MFVEGETRLIYTLKHNLFLSGRQWMHSFPEWQTRQHFKNLAEIFFYGDKFVVPFSRHGVRDQHRVGTRSGQTSRFDIVMNELFAGKAIFVITPERGNNVQFGGRIK